MNTPYRAGPVVWVANIAATCLILFLFQKILWLVVPAIGALIVYYALLPLKHRLVLAGFSHVRSTTLASLLAFGLTFGTAAFVLPGASSSPASWQEHALRYANGGIEVLAASVADLETRLGLAHRGDTRQILTARLAEFGEHFREKYLPGLVLGIAAWSPSLLLTPFLAYFMLRDGWRFRQFLVSAVPNAYFERSLHLLSRLDRTARLYFIGLLQLTLLDTFCLAAGLWAIGISSPLLLGLVTAVLAWVPYVGSILGCTLVLLVAATDFPGQPSVVYLAIGLFLLVRLLDDFVFMPVTIGKSLDMHPLLTVLMIFIGGAVAGVPGLMLVLPVLGVVMVLGETLGQLLTDPRLRARHTHERALRQRRVTADLHLP